MTHPASNPAASRARDITESYWRSECRRDLQGVLDHYHPDAVFVTPTGRLVGHEQIAAFYAASFERFPQLALEVVGGRAHADDAALEWKALLTRPDGTGQLLLGVNVVRVDGDRFREVHTYFDASSFA